MKSKKPKVIIIEVLKEIVFRDMHPKHQEITEFNGDGEIVILLGAIVLYEKQDPRGSEEKIWVLPGTLTGMSKTAFEIEAQLGSLKIISTKPV